MNTATPGSITATREQSHRDGHTMSKVKKLLREVNGKLTFPADAELNWEKKGGFGNVPEYWGARILGIDVCLRDGLKPSDEIVGRIEVKANLVTQKLEEDEISNYLYVNVFPLPAGASADTVVSIVRAAKEGKGSERHKVLPPEFNPETDYVVNRGRFGDVPQPWQIILVRVVVAAPTA